MISDCDGLVLFFFSVISFLDSPHSRCLDWMLFCYKFDELKQIIFIFLFQELEYTFGIIVWLFLLVFNFQDIEWVFLTKILSSFGVL